MNRWEIVNIGKEYNMKIIKLQQQIQNVLQSEIQSKRQEETISLCIQIMRKLQNCREEPRTGFWRYLSDVFRFDGISILGLQIVTLFLVCVMLKAAGDVPEYIPSFIPLFALAVMPSMLRSQFYGVSEIEAVTRASGAQIILAKFILAGAANLVCITVLLWFQIGHQNSYENIGQMVLYCIVPYLVCMTVMLRVVRLCKRENILICAAVILIFCVCWGISATMLPWLYETSAIGFWITAFVVFAIFYIKEIYYIITMRKEGKIYGVID